MTIIIRWLLLFFIGEAVAAAFYRHFTLCEADVTARREFDHEAMAARHSMSSSD